MRMLKFPQRKHSGQLRCLAVISLALLSVGCVMYAVKTDYRMMEMQSQMRVMEAVMRSGASQEHERVKRSVSDSDERKREKRASSDGDEAPVTSFGLPGVTYKRWGRINCPQGTRIVYHGLAAGTWYAHQGGTSETLCLHMNVSYTPGHFIDQGQGSSHIYGLEFRDSNWINPLFDLSLIEGHQLQYHSVPCAVCLAKARMTQLMIPGQEICPEGWNKEYAGYIMTSGHGDNHAGSPLCVDEQPQVVPGTDGDQKGNFLFMAETQCNSLLCEPYIANREIRCVVCTL